MLADAWGVDPRGEGKSIWFELYEKAVEKEEEKEAEEKKRTEGEKAERTHPGAAKSG